MCSSSAGHSAMALGVSSPVSWQPPSRDCVHRQEEELHVSCQMPHTAELLLWTAD